MFPVPELPTYGPYFNWNEDPFRIFNQNFGTGLRDHELMPNIPTPRNWALAQLHHHHRPRRPTHTPKESGFSEVVCSKDKFEVKLDVHHFLPEEITIKTVDFYIVVEGRHEEREDPHGFISRNFQRRYLLPDDVKMEYISCDLSSDGVLIITVPRVEAIKDSQEKILPITQTGKPALVHVHAQVKADTVNVNNVRFNNEVPSEGNNNKDVHALKMNAKPFTERNVIFERIRDKMCDKKNCEHNGECEKKV